MKNTLAIAYLLCIYGAVAQKPHQKQGNNSAEAKVLATGSQLEVKSNRAYYGGDNQSLLTTNASLPGDVQVKHRATRGIQAVRPKRIRASKRDEEEDIPAATDSDLKMMCDYAKCGYHSPPTFYISDYASVLPKMLQFAKQRNIRVVGKKLFLQQSGPILEQITRSAEEDSMDYTVEFSRGQRVQLNDEYRKYITEGIEDLQMLITNLNRIDDGFFEKFFPNLQNLKVFPNGINHQSVGLPKFNIGFLPKLAKLRVEYVITEEISGCNLPLGQTSCFAENVEMTLVVRNTDSQNEIGLVDFHLTENVKLFKLSLINTIVKPTKVLVDKSIDDIQLTFDSTAQIAGINFTTTTAKTKFFLNGGESDDRRTVVKNLDTMLHNPSIAKIWVWRYRHSSGLRVPVVFKSAAVEQPFEDIKEDDLGKTTCKFAKEVADYGNEFSKLVERKDPNNPERTIKVLTVRGLYVDMSEVVEDRSTFDEMEVTAFHVHVSANKDVTFPLRVSYMRITSNDDAAIYNTLTSDGGDVKSKGSTGAQLRLRSSVDAIFMQVIKICTAAVIAQERNLGSIDANEKSAGNQMWSYSIPSTLDGEDSEITKAEMMIVKVGEFVEYLQETASEKAMRVPYLSLEYQQQNMVVLLGMAESIVQEKRHNEMMVGADDLRMEVLENQDRSTLTLLHTEYKRTVSLVLISTRRAHDIEKKLNATIDLVDEVSATFDKYKVEMEAANRSFQAGVTRAKAFAYAEVAAAVTSSVISFFTGGFDPGKIARAAKKLKDMALKIKKLMNLRKIFAKLASLVKTLRNIQELSKKAGQTLGGRIGRLFEKLTNFRLKRKSYLEKLMKESGSMAVKGPLLLKKKVENQKFIDKYTKIFEKVSQGRESVDYLNSAIQGIVEAEQAKVTLANAWVEGSVEGTHTAAVAEEPRVTTEDINEALENEFAIAAGDQQEQLEDLKKTLKEYELGESKNVIQEGEKLNAADVLEWDAANANVEGTMDASISMDIPETTSFKAALLKMNLAGKVKTEAMIDEAAIRVDLDRARFETTTYFKEGSEILKKIKKIEDGIKKRKHGEDIRSTEFKNSYKKQLKEQRMRLGWREFNVKFSVLIASLSYCSAYYYFHLSLCPPEHSFDFETSLENMVSQQRELQRQSLLQLEDFYPPPQTMRDRTLTFTKVNNTCRCMIRAKNSRNVFRNPVRIYKKWLECDGVGLPPYNGGDIDVETKRLLEVLARGCEVNKVEDMKEFKRIDVEIGVHSDLAAGHSRVRIDQMRVILYGARTNDGVIRLSIESSGVSQDRYKGEIFNFYGDKWRRDFSYFSPQSKIGSSGHGRVHILDAADVYKSFRGVYRTSTLFTNWIIKVDPKRNPGLDLSRLEQIEITFSGSFVAGGDYNLPQLEDTSDVEEQPEEETRQNIMSQTQIQATH